MTAEAPAWRINPYIDQYWQYRWYAEQLFGAACAYFEEQRKLQPMHQGRRLRELGYLPTSFISDLLDVL